jgi:lipoyl(octanoyl) transferase
VSPDAPTREPAAGATRAAAGDGAGGARPGHGDAAGGPADRAGDGAGPALSRPGEERPEIAAVPFPGRTPYREALELQRALARARIDGRLGHDLLLLLEHEPVLTLGRGTGEGHLRAGRERLEEAGVETVEIERGGDVTYHGPGQLVGYPILDLARYRKDLHWYLRAVEEALIRALGELGLPAFRVPEHTGVWVGDEDAVAGSGSGSGGAGRGDAADAGRTADAASADGDPGDGGADSAASAVLDGRVRKIASIGVHVSRWVTWHGFALNVTEEPMENFRLIVPCGIRGVRMTSLRGEGAGAGRARVRGAVAAGFASVFDARVTERDGVPDVPGAPAGPAGGADPAPDARPSDDHPPAGRSGDASRGEDAG